MGRRAQFSEKQIIAAGIELEELGIVVSPFAIRNKLGGGCTDRIKVAWKKHTSQLSQIIPRDHERAPSIDDTCIYAEVQKLRKVIKEKESEIILSQALAITDKTKIDEQHTSLSQLHIEVKELTAENATLKSRIDNLEKRIQQLILTEIENSRLMREVGKLEGVIQNLLHGPYNP